MSTAPRLRPRRAPRSLTALAVLITLVVAAEVYLAASSRAQDARGARSKAAAGRQS